MIKIECGVAERTQVLQIAEHFGAKIVDYGSQSLVLRVFGGSEKLDALTALLEPFRLIELVRSGKILMARGRAST